MSYTHADLTIRDTLNGLASLTIALQGAEDTELRKILEERRQALSTDFRNLLSATDID